MNPEDVGKILDEIGERIGPAGEYAFELAVRQQLITGALWTVLWAGVIALCVIAVRWALRKVAVIDTLADAIAKLEESTKAIKAEADAFRHEKEAAQLETLTPEERADWYRTWSTTFGAFGRYYGSSGLGIEPTREERAPYYAVVVIAGIVSTVAVFSLANVLPRLLNPEWKAIEALIGVIR